MKRKSLIVFTYLLFFFSLVFLSDNSQAQQIVGHQDDGFTISIPDNFEAIPKGLMPHGWLCGFKERTGMRDEPQITIGIEKAAGVIKDENKRIEKLKERFTAAGSSVSTEVFNANSSQIKCIRVINTIGKVKSIMLVVELPVRGEFIQVIAGGNIEREREINQIFDNIMLSFKTNVDPWDKYSG